MSDAVARRGRSRLKTASCSRSTRTSTTRLARGRKAAMNAPSRSETIASTGGQGDADRGDRHGRIAAADQVESAASRCVSGHYRSCPPAPGASFAPSSELRPSTEAPREGATLASERSTDATTRSRGANLAPSRRIQVEAVKTRPSTTKRQRRHPRLPTRSLGSVPPTGLLGTRSSPRTLYTIGHSTRSAGELVDVLRAFGVTRLIDVRSIPRSRINPQFNLDVLPATLHSAGIAYVHLASLGGLRTKNKHVEEGANAGWERRPFRNYADYAETAPFHEGLRELLEMASRETCAIMCAEAVWWRCHRRIVADHVLAHGVPVVHVFTQEKSEPASLTPFAVIGDRARVSYPAPTLWQINNRAPAEGPPGRRPASVVAHRVPSTRRTRGLGHHHGTDVASHQSMAHSAKSGFHVGDHVSWNSEAGRVRGVIKKKLTAPTKLKGYIVRASEEEPQYVIESDKTDHVAVHKGLALRKLRGAGVARRSRQKH
jgi:hypothetical protein